MSGVCSRLPGTAQHGLYEPKQTHKCDELQRSTMTAASLVRACAAAAHASMFDHVQALSSHACYIVVEQDRLRFATFDLALLFNCVCENRLDVRTVVCSVGQNSQPYSLNSSNIPCESELE